MNLDLVTWDITSECNLNCKHCYNADKYFKVKRESLSTKQCFKVIDRLTKLGFTTINFLGGEPMLRKDFIEIVSYARENNFNVSFTTNGIFLDAEKLMIFDKLGLKDICISLDGGCEETNDKIRGIGTFNKVYNNLSAISNVIENIDVRLYISFTLTNTNCNDLPKLIDLCKKFGIYHLIIGTLVVAGNGFNNFSDLNSETKKLYEKIDEGIWYISQEYPELCVEIDCRPIMSRYFQQKYGINILYNKAFTNCSYKLHSMYIESDGKLHPCNLFNMHDISLNLNEYNKYCNISVFDLTEKIIEGFKNFDSLYNDATKSMYMLEQCENCKVKNICMPCPFQFRSLDKYESCIYAYDNFSTIERESKNWTIGWRNENIEFYGNLSTNLVKNIEVGKSIYENYLITKEKKAYFEYIDLLFTFENFGLLKINRNKKEKIGL